MYRNFDAVIWDFGGVITSSPFEAFARFETANELPKDFIRSINATNPDTNAWALFERNEIDTVAFDAAFQAEAAAQHAQSYRHKIEFLEATQMLKKMHSDDLLGRGFGRVLV